MLWEPLNRFWAESYEACKASSQKRAKYLLESRRKFQVSRNVHLFGWPQQSVPLPSRRKPFAHSHNPRSPNKMDLNRATWFWTKQLATFQHLNNNKMHLWSELNEMFDNWIFDLISSAKNSAPVAYASDGWYCSAECQSNITKDTWKTDWTTLVQRQTIFTQRKRSLCKRVSTEFHFRSSKKIGFHKKNQQSVRKTSNFFFIFWINSFPRPFFFSTVIYRFIFENDFCVCRTVVLRSALWKRKCLWYVKNWKWFGSSLLHR